MEYLIDKNKNRVGVQYSPSFRECIEILGSTVNILEQDESEDVYDKMQEDFPFAWWGRIDWDNIEKRVIAKSGYDILNFIRTSLGTKGRSVFILWGYASDHVISTDLQNVMDNIEYINAIGQDQWMYNPIDKYIVEFFHDGDINIAWL